MLETSETASWVAGARTGRLPSTMPFSFHVFKKHFIKPVEPEKSESAERVQRVAEDIKQEDEHAADEQAEKQLNEEPVDSDETKQPKTAKRATKKGE